VLQEDVFFNGARYQAGTGISMGKTEWKRFYAFYDVNLDKAGGHYLLLGAMAEFITFHLQGTLSPLTERTEQFEGFSRQPILVPALGLGKAAGPSSPVFWEVYGTRVHHANFGYHEGGDMKVSQSAVDAALGVQRTTGVLRPSIALRYQYLWLDQDSPEDTNTFLIEGAGIEIGLLARF